MPERKISPSQTEHHNEHKKGCRPQLLKPLQAARSIPSKTSCVTYHKFTT